MGKHVNAGAGSDEAEVNELADGATGTAAPHEPARHVAEAGHPLEPQAVISPDTHVGVDLGAAPPGVQDAVPSPTNPDALIEHGLVGDGHEME
jgi:hypothetical protein